jgi:hypothetical protein
MTAEAQRLTEARQRHVPWRKWGPYLSERQWGTVREDYGGGQDTWNFFSHDQARSRAYRSGEDGLAGICDDQQRLCFAIALWNGADSILKERLFGLINSQGNHGEDVKEYYFYLDSTPTHSYMRYLYKYPQVAYPYQPLIDGNAARSRLQPEYELLDTGSFSGSRYFDVFVEYAKATPEEILIRITAINRGSMPALLEMLPTLWFRKTWWSDGDGARPLLKVAKQINRGIAATHSSLGERFLYCDGEPELLFTENETNSQRLFGTANATQWVKDAFHEYVVHAHAAAVNPGRTGTKAAARCRFQLAPQDSVTVRLRLAPALLTTEPFGRSFDLLFSTRQQEAKEFYAELAPPGLGADAAGVMRQALAGMLWSKQFYCYDVARWKEDNGVDPYAEGASLRNSGWPHLTNYDIISMPDKWEYPWYAAWDLAFHVIALNLVDPDFAKQQLALMLTPRYLHPNGQIPAYEWNFSDVNPPVHAWAAWFIYAQDKARCGTGDLRFLEYVFRHLLMNFTWWVNRKDPEGSNLFGGGFLGLDNIGVFDRNASLPAGARLEQADGTAWMAFYCQMMLQISVELARQDPVYQSLAAKFYEHFLWIAGAMDSGGQGNDLWDEEDGFFYDALVRADGTRTRLKVRSIVGLLAIAASTVFQGDEEESLPLVFDEIREFRLRHPQLERRIIHPERRGCGGRRLLALLNEEKLRRVLRYMLDEEEFLSPFGIRSVSRVHRDFPYVLQIAGQELRVDYEPAESTTGMFGGNSNWRGPIWFPMNVLLIRALLNLHAYYGKDFTVECPTGSGTHMTLFQVAQELGRRLTSIFVRDEQGARPVHGEAQAFQADPHWRDLILFYEYFHGNTGAGLGASHQTGWTGLVAPLIYLFGQPDAEAFLEAEWRSTRVAQPITAADQYAHVA